MSDNPSYFSILTADVRYSEELSDFAKVLYSDITALCNIRGYCSATNDYFAQRFNKSKRTISATIAQIADAGYIRIDVERAENNEVTGRKIWVRTDAQQAAERVHAPMEENFHRYGEKAPEPMEENFHRYGEKVHEPMEENFQAYNRKNNTSKNNTSNTPIAPSGDDGLFEQFWAAYPKRVAKQPARRAFERLHVDHPLLDKMLAALDWQKQSDSWRRDGGRYIPNPATWLNARRWEDEPGKAATAAKPTDQVARSPDDTILSEWEQQWQENHRKEIRRRRLEAESDHGR